MNLNVIAFSDRGHALAERIATEYGGTAVYGGRDIRTSDWVKQNWGTADALVFVGAMGIAVRSIAPYIEHKAKDPAVVVIDELGRHTVSVLSGHLGGANKLTFDIAEKIGSDPVITTATDVNNLFAVDEWARAQGMKVQTPSRIKNVSSRILAGKEISVKCFERISGETPKQVVQTESDDCDVLVEITKKSSGALILIPQICTLGVGCRKGTSKEHIEDAFKRFLSESKIEKSAITEAASIDVKKDEKGLLEFAGGHKWNIEFYSADELNKVKGSQSSSKFVLETVGVDNVCERSALRIAGDGAELVVKKFAYEGVTFAVAKKKFTPDWSC